MNRKNKPVPLAKGEYGYLKKQKMIQLSISFLLLLMVAVIFYTGYIKYHHTKNIFTVMAAVSVIPMARFFFFFLVLSPCRSIPEDQYQSLQLYENVIFAYDLVISSEERVIPVKIAAIRDHVVLLFVDHPKIRKDVVEKYIKSILASECRVTTVKMMSGFSEFEKAVRMINKNEAGRFDNRIRELLILFSV